MKKQHKQPKAVVIPAAIRAEIECADIHDRSTGDLSRMIVRLPGLNDFFITDGDLEPVIQIMKNHYGLDDAQAEKAAHFLASLPNIRAKNEQRKRAEARRANNENSWSGWKPATRSY
ncbi:hypothetical protein [Acinetobacter gerneri]|uniref:hypothetical protein n=1 Tax=Acinetobacter gerneri TaxID=202952 RepID=UPI0028A5B02C|nr:hypothetical protein [Acinetobacter gerneri]